uniref:N-terminal E2 ubiquitin-conjugating enzyme n=1 Tax=Anopheles coluzzii TaxID=1518534 RepID=A0A6E8VM11_ANOCL
MFTTAQANSPHWGSVIKKKTNFYTVQTRKTDQSPRKSILRQQKYFRSPSCVVSVCVRVPVPFYGVNSMSKPDCSKKTAMSPSERRLQKELMSLIKEPPPGVSVDEESVSQNLTQWIINIDGVEGTLYEGEHFQLLFKFNNKYPFDSPEVTFIGSNIPIHPHVYSNGHICLSILTDDWSPALSVQSVCLSISSMLSSCREKRRPPDNGIYVKTCNKNPKKTKWWYHDDSV